MAKNEEKVSKNDDKIKILLDKIEKQQNALGSRPKPIWITNAIFKYPDSSRYFNINTVRDPQELVEALAFLLEKESVHKIAADRLGLPTKPFMWQNFLVSDWENDFKKRVELITWETKKLELEETKKKLKVLVSEESRTEMELENIEKLLG